MHARHGNIQRCSDFRQVQFLDEIELHH